MFLGRRLKYSSSVIAPPTCLLLPLSPSPLSLSLTLSLDLPLPHPPSPWLSLPPSLPPSLSLFPQAPRSWAMISRWVGGRQFLYPPTRYTYLLTCWRRRTVKCQTLHQDFHLMPSQLSNLVLVPSTGMCPHQEQGGQRRRNLMMYVKRIAQYLCLCTHVCTCTCTVHVHVHVHVYLSLHMYMCNV